MSAWKFGLIGDPAIATGVLAEVPEPEPEAPESEEVKLQRVWSEGHSAGHAQGHAAASDEAGQRMDAYVGGQGRETSQHLSALVASLEARLHQCEQQMGRQVLDLACELARHVVRRELAVHTDAVLPVVREALGMLLRDGKAAVVRLHPQELELLGAALREEFSVPSIHWVADPTVERGGCLVESGGTVIDGSVATRWQRSLANLGLETPWQEEPAHAE